MALEHCVECGHTVASSAIRCPGCGTDKPAPSQRRKARRGRKLFAAVGGLIALCFFIAWISDYEVSGRLAVGQTYAVEKFGCVCDTLGDLSSAEADGVATLSRAQMYGCVLIGPNDHVNILAKDAAVVRVRVEALGGERNHFEGWTEAEILQAPPARLKSPL